MTCSRAHDLDLAAYLVDPAAPEWQDFRGHYPTCRECAAAVQSWTSLEQALRARAPEGVGAAHPAPAHLEAFDSAPSTLAPERWAAIDVHVQSCRRCADELAALRSFDLEGLAATAPKRRVDALRDVGRALGDGVRALAGRVGETAEEALGSLGSEPAVAVQSATESEGCRMPVAVLVSVGELAGQVLTLFEGEPRIGRDEACELRLTLDSLPRIAARVEVEPGRCTLISTAARPPVLVNGEPVEQALLQDGDRVTLGTEVFEFRLIGG